MKVWKKLLIAMTAVSCALFAFGCSGSETTNTESVSSEIESSTQESSTEESSESLVESSVVESESEEESNETESSEDIHTCITEGEWHTNETEHWLECDCGKLVEYGSHEGTATDCDSRPICSICEVPYGTPSGHTYGELSDGEFGKAYYCTCGAYMTNEDLVDFIVEVESGKDPVVLQLSDTQTWSWGDSPEIQCYRYIREVVEKTNPDLIILTGDLVYGKFDPEGTLLKSLIDFMETLDTPWAPVFGNHDNESLMGVDWQCQQLEAAENCLFKQGDVTGNGNYTVGIEQDGELLRVFYMMDSNGCGNPMIDSNGVHTAPTPGTNVVQTNRGFGGDQITWYTDSINAIHAVDEDVKISFAYHIQQAIFETAFEKYDEYNGLSVDSSSSILANPLNLDTLEGADDTDFGYLGRQINAPWDMDNTIFNGMKALGCDSIFVGHEHCNSVSIVYDGVRFQYGQKSSTYDRYNSVSEDGTITGAYEGSHPTGSHPLIGGTVIPISSVDGSIGTGYICYAGNPFNFDPKSDITAWENAGAEKLGSPLNSSEALAETFGGLTVYKTNGGYGQSIVNKSIDSSNYSELYFAFKATQQVTLSNGNHDKNVITPNVWYFVNLEKQADGSWTISAKAFGESEYTAFTADEQFFGAGKATFETMFRTYLWTSDTYNHEVYATDVWGKSIVGDEIAAWETAGAVKLGSAINSSVALDEKLGSLAVYKTNGGYGQSIVNKSIDASNYTEFHFAFKATQQVNLSNGDYDKNVIAPNTWYFVKLEKQADGNWTISVKKVGDSAYTAFTASTEFFGAGNATFETMFRTYLWIADAMENNHEVYATDVWGK